MRGGRRQAPDSGRAFRDEVFGYVTPWSAREGVAARAFRTKQDFVSPVWPQVREDANRQPDIPGTHIIDAQWVSDVSRSDGRGPAIMPRVMYERNSMSESDVSAIIYALLTLANEHAFEGFVFEIPIVPGTMDLLTRVGGALRGAGKLLILVLQCASNRSALDAILRAEMRINDGKYTDKQVEVLQKTCDDIVSKSLEDIQLATTPEWFIPWIWLEMNEKQLPEEGEFGSVITARWLDSEIVVKKLEIDSKDAANDDKKREMRLMFEREVDIWFGLSHPHVVRLFGACHVGRPFFVCELASKGTLDEYLRHHPDKLWSKLREAALGVQYLHAGSIVHGDLKGNNILIGSDGKAKVTDFGLSGVFDDDSTDFVVSGAWHWVAPECILGQKPTFASDIYSFGMCIIEALRATNGDEDDLPWGRLPNAAVKFHATKLNKLPSRPQNCRDEVWTLIERMCRNDPADRILIMTVVDELEKLVDRHGDSTTETDEMFGNNGEVRWSPLSVADELAEMKNWIVKYDAIYGWEGGALKNIYQLLWDLLKQVATQVFPDGEDTVVDEVIMSDSSVLVEHSKQRTRTALGTTGVIPLIKFTELALGGYALHRRLDKFMAAHSVPKDLSSLHDWTSVCSAFMGVNNSPNSACNEEDCSVDKTTGDGTKMATSTEGVAAL